MTSIDWLGISLNPVMLSSQLCRFICYYMVLWKPGQQGRGFCLSPCSTPSPKFPSLSPSPLPFLSDSQNSLTNEQGCLVPSPKNRTSKDIYFTQLMQMLGCQPRRVESYDIRVGRVNSV